MKTIIILEAKIKEWTWNKTPQIQQGVEITLMLSGRNK